MPKAADPAMGLHSQVSSAHFSGPGARTGNNLFPSQTYVGFCTPVPLFGTVLVPHTVVYVIGIKLTGEKRSALVLVKVSRPLAAALVKIGRKEAMESGCGRTPSHWAVRS